MENKGLLFIPDISGFTKFVNETEIDHSRLIIQELLETLINTNELGLEISEIEGDAILFYKFGETPNLQALYKQVEKMFVEFHKHLVAYEHSRFCQCHACKSAVQLTLKVITHYGEFTGYNVRNFNKLIGKDIIVAHQLLKNDIEQHEYWLVTHSLAQDQPPSNLTNWMEWSSSAKKTDQGEIPFHYTQLTQLKNEVPASSMPLLELSKKTKVLSLTDTYDTDIITLFHATGDFTYRSRWQIGVEKVEEISHYLPRIGMRSKFTLDNGQSFVYASSYTYQSDKIEFSETDEKKKSTLYFTLETIDRQKTRLTIDFYVKKGFPTPLLFKLNQKKKMEADLQKSLAKLHVLLKEIPSFAIDN
ncbi:MAG: DUF2652 domain-containing protein [Bacteroidetes bacterium]|nr:DUF2652 domain-containing protein [Bacteroidota bacterium]